MTGPGRVVVIAVGSRDRGDDGVGPAVAEALDGRLPACATLLAEYGEPGRLIAAWDGAYLAVVVDAVAPEPGVRTGAVHVFDMPTGVGDGVFAMAERSVSSHDEGVAAALALGRAVHRLPVRMVVVGVTGERFDLGAPLSPAVSAVVPVVCELVLSAVSRNVG